MDNLNNRLTFLEQEVANLKEQFKGQPMKRSECDECGKSIHHENAKFCTNCGTKLVSESVKPRSRTTTIEGRLVMLEDDICIGTKEGIYHIPAVFRELADEIGTDGSKFVRATLDGDIHIITKNDGIYYIPDVMEGLADTTETGGSKFARLTFEEINENSSRS